MGWPADQFYAISIYKTGYDTITKRIAAAGEAFCKLLEILEKGPDLDARWTNPQSLRAEPVVRTEVDGIRL